MKKIGYILFLICALLVYSDVKADYSASISASSYTVTVGQNVTVTIFTQNLMGVYSVESSNPDVLIGYVQGDASIDSPNSFSKNIVFTAKAKGSATITFSPKMPAGLTDYDLLQKVNFSRTITINVVEKNSPKPIDVNRTYNKNNYLKSLSIDGYTLEPAFNKDTLEYSLNLLPGTENINISASVEESTSSVKGVGEINVSEGINTINVVVTAENGNERTYVIKASVDEKDPIEVVINNKKYRVIKKRELIGSKENFDETIVKINNFDIPGLYNAVTKVVLVGLKDEDGNIDLYSYNSKNGEYREYNELKFDLMNLYIQRPSNSKYEEATIKINGKEVIAYKINNIKDYYLLYATNVTTGNTGYYLYDVKENSVQRYSTHLLDSITKEKDKYFALVIVLSCVCFLCMLFLLIEVNIDNKRSE